MGDEDRFAPASSGAVLARSFADPRLRSDAAAPRGSRSQTTSAPIPHDKYAHMNRRGWHVEINKKLTACSSVSDVCRLIEEHAAEFNAVNVVTALRKVLLNSRGLSRQLLEKTQQTLEQCVVSRMEDFEARQVSNILHVFAKHKYRPWDAQILTCLERRALETAGEFNSQNVANTLWAYASLGRDPGKGLLHALERRALETAGEFNSQEVANTLWAYARMGREPGEGILYAMESQALEKAGEFNSQNVANTLWAYVSLGREPGEGLLHALERRALETAGEFNSQDVANTLWALCFLVRCYPAVACRLSLALQPRVQVLAKRQEFGNEGLSQMHQFFLSCTLEESLRMHVSDSLVALKEEFEAVCRSAFLGHRTTPSASQQQVSDTLRGMGLTVEDEFRCPVSGHSIDMRVVESAPASSSKESSVGARERAPSGKVWAVEFDGPSHFMSSGSPTGATVIKQRQLELLGYALVSVPSWEWDRLGKEDNARQEYLRARLSLRQGSTGSLEPTML